MACRGTLNSFVPELLYLIAACTLLVQYIGKQEHKKLYLQDQPHQTFSIAIVDTLCCSDIYWIEKYYIQSISKEINEAESDYMNMGPLNYRFSAVPAYFHVLMHKTHLTLHKFVITTVNL